MSNQHISAKDHFNHKDPSGGRVQDVFPYCSSHQFQPDPVLILPCCHRAWLGFGPLGCPQEKEHPLCFHHQAFLGGVGIRASSRIATPVRPPPVTQAWQRAAKPFPTLCRAGSGPLCLLSSPTELWHHGSGVGWYWRDMAGGWLGRAGAAGWLCLGTSPLCPGTAVAVKPSLRSGL